MRHIKANLNAHVKHFSSNNEFWFTQKKLKRIYTNRNFRQYLHIQVYPHRIKISFSYIWPKKQSLHLLWILIESDIIMHKWQDFNFLKLIRKAIAAKANAYWNNHWLVMFIQRKYNCCECFQYLPIKQSCCMFKDNIILRKKHKFLSKIVLRKIWFLFRQVAFSCQLLSKTAATTTTTSTINTKYVI